MTRDDCAADIRTAANRCSLFFPITAATLAFVASACERGDETEWAVARAVIERLSSPFTRTERIFPGAHCFALSEEHINAWMSADHDLLLVRRLVEARETGFMWIYEANRLDGIEALTTAIAERPNSGLVRHWGSLRRRLACLGPIGASHDWGRDALTMKMESTDPSRKECGRPCETTPRRRWRPQSSPTP